jgi:hypothetical protein
LSLEVVRGLIPPSWFEYLSDIRSPSFQLPNESVCEYEKFCSMGNGFCFPLQTLVFASVCHAAARYCGVDDDFSVYGDDIVVRQSIALLVIEMLREHGFRTNVDKTFVTGPFRESCGADWYEGQDVRPVHIADKLVDVRQLFALHNSTLRSSRTTHLLSEMRNELRILGGGNFLRPGSEPGDSAFSVPLDVAMNSPFVKWSKKDQRWGWKEIASRSVPDPGRLGEVEHANALMLAVMRGSDSHMPFTLRRLSRAAIAKVARPWRDGHNQKLRPSLDRLTGPHVTVREVRKAVTRY